MKRAETCSCTLCNKLYTYLYHHTVVLDKYIHSNLVYKNYNSRRVSHKPIRITKCFLIHMQQRTCWSSFVEIIKMSILYTNSWYFTFKVFLFLSAGAANKSYWLNLSRESRKLRQTALTNNKATGHSARRHKYHTLNKVSFDVFLVATLCGCLLCNEIIFLFSEYLFLSSPFPSFIVSFIYSVCPILLTTAYVATAIPMVAESVHLAVLYNAWVSFITNTKLDFLRVVWPYIFLMK